jgi:hypothetical protein
MGVTDDRNNFVDVDNGLISGTVTDDNGNPIPGTHDYIKMKDANDVAVLTATADSSGKYAFNNLEPGDYTILESNLPLYPGDLSNFDEIPESDESEDSNKTTENVIGVTIKPGEKDVGNIFVDR